MYRVAVAGHGRREQEAEQRIALKAMLMPPTWSPETNLYKTALLFSLCGRTRIGISASETV